MCVCFCCFCFKKPSQIAHKPFLVSVRRVILFQSELVNFCLQRCLIFQKQVYHTTTLKWIRKGLDFLRKKPLTAYEFGIIRKSITNRKADRLCRTAFSGISMPENHTPLSCFKIDGWKSTSKSIQKPQIFIKKSSFFSFTFFIPGFYIVYASKMQK